MQRDWNGSYTMNESDYMEVYEQLSRDLARAREVLKDWQEFAKDSFVTVGEREFDKLGYLERRTQEVLEP
jgi:hypothetical protein